jgi:hypothetical protein
LTPASRALKTVNLKPPLRVLAHLGVGLRGQGLPPDGKVPRAFQRQAAVAETHLSDATPSTEGHQKIKERI